MRHGYSFWSSTTTSATKCGDADQLGRAAVGHKGNLPQAALRLTAVTELTPTAAQAAGETMDGTPPLSVQLERLRQLASFQPLFPQLLPEPPGLWA